MARMSTYLFWFRQQDDDPVVASGPCVVVEARTTRAAIRKALRSYQGDRLHVAGGDRLHNNQLFIAIARRDSEV